MMAGGCSGCCNRAAHRERYRAALLAFGATPAGPDQFVMRRRDRAKFFPRVAEILHDCTGHTAEFRELLRRGWMTRGAPCLQWAGIVVHFDVKDDTIPDVTAQFCGAAA